VSEPGPPEAQLNSVAVTQGTAGIRDVFESVSERIVRHLTVRAHGTSRPPSPGVLDSLGQGSSSFEFGANIGPGLDSTYYGDFQPSALDSFLLQPLGQSSMEEWERTLFSDLNTTDLEMRLNE
jgi:hypothetical protein